MILPSIQLFTYSYRDTAIAKSIFLIQKSMRLFSVLMLIIILE